MKESKICLSNIQYMGLDTSLYYPAIVSYLQLSFPSHVKHEMAYCATVIRCGNLNPFLHLLINNFYSHTVLLTHNKIQTSHILFTICQKSKFEEEKFNFYIYIL